MILIIENLILNLDPFENAQKINQILDLLKKEEKEIVVVMKIIDDLVDEVTKETNLVSSMEKAFSGLQDLLKAQGLSPEDVLKVNGVFDTMKANNGRITAAVVANTGIATPPPVIPPVVTP